MSDDHAAHAIGAYGGRLAKLNPTPTIDRLASEGMLFENCFAVNSICTPSRAAVLTGQYNHTNKVYDLTGHLEAARQFLPNELNKAGYQTAMIGKWHLESEPASFDYYGVSRDGKLPSTPPAWELYDLTKDPQELVNVYDEPAYANIVTDLKRELASRRQQIGDDGQDYPEIEAVVQEFWNYDARAR